MRKKQRIEIKVGEYTNINQFGHGIEYLGIGEDQESLEFEFNKGSNICKIIVSTQKQIVTLMDYEFELLEFGKDNVKLKYIKKTPKIKSTRK